MLAAGLDGGNTSIFSCFAREDVNKSHSLRQQQNPPIGVGFVVRMKGREIRTINCNSPVGSDPTAASGGCREGSEWQRSHCKERLTQATRRAGTATGIVACRRSRRRQHLYLLLLCKRRCKRISQPPPEKSTLRRAFFNEINPCGICEIPLCGVKYGFAM